MPDYFKIRQGNQWLRPASTTCGFRISDCMANLANCICPAVLPLKTKIAFQVSIFLNHKLGLFKYV